MCRARHIPPCFPKRLKNVVDLIHIKKQKQNKQKTSVFLAEDLESLPDLTEPWENQEMVPPRKEPQLREAGNGLDLEAS